MEKRFAKWAEKEGVGDDRLVETALEAFAGLVDADLGGYLYKKRLAREGKGKSGGYRAILCFRTSGEERVYFLHGFAKNAKGTLTKAEEKALKLIAKSLMGLRQEQIAALVERGALREVKRTGDGAEQ